MYKLNKHGYKLHLEDMSIITQFVYNPIYVVISTFLVFVMIKSLIISVSILPIVLLCLQIPWFIIGVYYSFFKQGILMFLSDIL